MKEYETLNLIDTLIAIKKIKDHFETRLANAQSAFDKAVADGATKVDDKLVKAAEEKVGTAKGELEKAAKALGEKFTKGGKAKWIAPVAGAAILGLAALGLRPKADA